jgi:hypothetical protein
MSYGYQDPHYDNHEYEYVDDGNHGDDGYHEYEQYSDDNEPDTTPSEPDHYEQYDDVRHHDDADYGDGIGWEIEPEGLEYGDDEMHEREPDWEAFEREEMEHGDNGGYLHEEVQHEREVDGHYQEVPEYEDDSTYGHDMLEHDDEDTGVFTLPDRDAVEPRAPSDASYVPTYPIHIFTYPNPHLSPAPAPTSPTRATPLLSNQRGHVTASNHAQHAPVFNNDEHEPAPADATSSSPPFLAIFDNNPPPSSTHSNHKTNPGKFKPHRLLYNHTKADNEAPPPPDFGGGYEEFGMDTETPEPWEFGDTPSKPPFYWNEKDLIKEAREGEPGAVSLLLKKWMIVGNQYSEGVQEIWRQQEAEHRERLREYEECRREYEELECERGSPPPGPVDVLPQPSLHLITPSSAPSLPTNHNNNDPAKITTPARPPPWPIKPAPSPISHIANLHLLPRPNQTQHQPASTPPARPPPWPIIPSPTIISSTPPARPPPWPIIPHRIQSTPQNRQNAKQRIKAKS